MRSRAAVAVARGSLERIRARLKEAEAAQTLGAITKADLMRLQALEANTELMVVDSDSTRSTLDRQLAIVMNDARPNPVYEVGDNVKKGQPIALSGSSGRSTGPHRDFEVLKLGRAGDALTFVRG